MILHAFVAFNGKETVRARRQCRCAGTEAYGHLGSRNVFGRIIGF